MNLEYYRSEIDRVDRELVRLFCARMDAAAEIGKLKKQSSAPVENKGRENAVLERVCSYAPEKYKACVEKLYADIFDISKAYQLKIMEVNNNE